MAKLNTKVEEVKQTGEAVHTLANSSALAQLKLTALALKQSAVNLHRIADMTKQKGDIDAARAADLVASEANKLYLEHEKKQIEVDAASAAAKKPTK